MAAPPHSAPMVADSAIHITRCVFSFQDVLVVSRKATVPIDETAALQR